MGLADKIAGWLGYAKPRRSVGFAAAELSRLTSSLRAESDFINTTLRWQLRTLRARARQAKQNNPFARRFVKMAVNNIAGPVPFRLQAKVKYNSGELDTSANRKIEDAWMLWGRKGSCELTGRYSWNAVQRLLIDNLATDGELLFRKLRGPEYGRHGYALQVIDVDRLDETKNAALPGGGAIHMGVEIDANSRPIAYHLLKRKPSQWASMGYSREYERVPAEDIEHIFIPEFAEQIRGVPWIYAALLNLVHLGAFEEAAVIAARVGASQMGFIQSPDGTPPPGDGSKDVRGNPQIDAEPGSFPTLPPGYQMASWNPKYPDAAIEPFIKAVLRGIAVGVDVAYHNLSGDMEGVNYSSARIAELDERDAWMTIQSFIAEHMHQPLYDDWLRMQVLTGELPFDIARLDKYRSVYWQARRWGWVDPEKEVTAAIKANEARLKSRTRIIAEGGEDIEDVLAEIAEEEKLAKKMGVELPVDPTKQPVQPAKPAGSDAGGNGGDAGAKGLRDLASAAISETASVARAALERKQPALPAMHFHPASVKVDNHVNPTPVEIKNDQTIVVEPAAAAVTVSPTPVTIENTVKIDEVKVQMPDRVSVSEIERDGRSNITRVTQTEKSA